jgi:hypothetical protein
LNCFVININKQEHAHRPYPSFAFLSATGRVMTEHGLKRQSEVRFTSLIQPRRLTMKKESHCCIMADPEVKALSKLKLMQVELSPPSRMFFFRIRSG